MANHANSGTMNANASYNVSRFSKFTVYAANASTVTLTAGSSTATHTVGATGVLTVTDLADSVAVNASYSLVGLVSNQTQ